MAADVLTEEQLMAAYVQGDRRAFQVLFAQLGPRVHAFFKRCFREPGVADDLFQTTFMKLHRSRNDYQSGRPLRPWLFAIAARVRLDELRRRYRLPAETTEDALETLDTVPSPNPRADDAIERQDRATWMQTVLSALPESQRAVVVLHHYEGMTFGEIATVLGTTEGAARIRAFRAYERIREGLGGMEGTA